MQNLEGNKNNSFNNRNHFTTSIGSLGISPKWKQSLLSLR